MRLIMRILIWVMLMGSDLYKFIWIWWNKVMKLSKGEIFCKIKETSSKIHFRSNQFPQRVHQSENYQAILKMRNNYNKNWWFNKFNSLIATSASRSFEKRTTPVSKPRISANLTSPISRNLSRKFCHVQFDGSLKKN